MKSWALPAAVIVAVEYTVVMLIAVRVGSLFKVPVAAYVITALTAVGIAATVAICVRLFQLYRQDVEHPLPTLIADAPRLAPFATGAVLAALHWAAIMWLKGLLPLSVGYWADPQLANFDFGLFGTDPWRIMHQAFWWAGPVIDRAYMTWAIVTFATLSVIVALPEGRRKSQALVAYFLTGAICALFQYALPSAGPIFFEAMGHGPRFAELPIAPWAETARDYLWQDYLRIGGDIGAGISAMPSGHVALSAWMAFVLRSFVPKLAPLGFVYFAVILIGSVYLGWHYAVDGVVAFVIAVFAWRVGRFTAPARDALSESLIRSGLTAH
jgi:hypothetical protein